MAARKRRTWIDDKWRERIQAGVLVERLVKHALGQIEMTATQLRAAEILLKKTIPDLSAVEHSGELEHTTYVAQLPAPLTALEWQNQHVVR